MPLAKAAACNPVANNQSAIGFLQELDRALHDFLVWQKNLYRALISEGVVNPDDISEDSHNRCAFAHWFISLPEDVNVKVIAISDCDEMWQQGRKSNVLRRTCDL